MWIVIALIVAALALLLWRLVVIVAQHRQSRPVDSGHPHVTDVDPHG